MRIHLQETYELKDGTLLPPHWDEWFDQSNPISKAIDVEEAIIGIANLGQWEEIQQTDIDNIMVGETLYSHQHKCMVEVITVPKYTNALGKFLVKFCMIMHDVDPEPLEVSQMEAPKLVRRIAEISDCQEVSDMLAGFANIEVQKINGSNTFIDHGYNITDSRGERICHTTDESLANRIKDMVISDERENLIKFLRQEFDFFINIRSLHAL